MDHWIGSLDSEKVCGKLLGQRSLFEMKISLNYLSLRTVWEVNYSHQNKASRGSPTEWQLGRVEMRSGKE